MAKLKKILVVDDDDTSNYITGQLLKKLEISERYKVLKNGQEALEFILDRCTSPGGDKICPELIFLDYRMPVMDGKEFIIALKEQNFTNWNDVKILVFSVNLHEEDIKCFTELGVKDFIEKPLTQEKVLSVISKYFPDENLNNY